MKIKLLLFLGILLPLGLHAQNVSQEETRKSLFGKKNTTETKAEQSRTKKSNFKGSKDLSNYLVGAVPVEDGRVVFTTEIPTEMSKSEMIKILSEWAFKQFIPEASTLSTEATDAKVVSVDPVSGKIVCEGDEYLVFTRKFLVLNQARIHYVLTIQCQDELCKLTLSKIRYDYNPTPEENTYTRIAAENLITDQYALRSKGTKLARESGTHFRVFTIDLKDELFSAVKQQLQGK